jgi:hypothetical protein
MTRAIEVAGRRLIAPCNPALDRLAQNALDKLASLHASQPALVAGSTILFGWAPLKVLETDGDWILHELDFTQADTVWVRGVGTTLEVLDWQAQIVHELHEKPQTSLHDDLVLLETDVESAESVFLDRIESKIEGSAGWYAGVDVDDSETRDKSTTLARVSEILSTHLEWMPFLALPVGFQLVFRARQLVELSDTSGRGLRIPPNPARHGLLPRCD